VSDQSSRRLPRGRYALSPEEVERIQRSRLAAAMAQVMAEKGYVATSVADVLKRSGVSRQTFYQVFTDKLDCFMAAFDQAAEFLLLGLLGVIEADERGLPGPEAEGDPLQWFEQAFTAYLEALALDLPYTRLFLVEVYAAGPEAIQRRTSLQTTITTMMADLMGVTSEAARFTCEMIVAATSTLVTNAVINNDLEALRALGPPVLEYVRTLWNAGAFGDRPR
jgi:AcrR family transcriptional regulator